MQHVTFSQQPAYKNKTLSPEARTKDLLSRMTLDEKLMQLQCIWGQKSAIMTNGDFDETKAAIFKNGGNFVLRVASIYQSISPFAIFRSRMKLFYNLLINPTKIL